MPDALTLSESNIGKKAIVAITGVVLFGFVIGHMLGNLQVFLGPEALNDYAAMLKSMPALLWPTRLVLLGSVVLHIYFSMQLARAAAVARPVGYRRSQRNASTYSSITMKYSGPLLGAFIVYHLAHFTWPGVAMGDYAHSHTDVYSNVVSGFQVPWVAAIYVVAQVLLGLHLYHGGWSLFQTLGFSHPRYNTLRARIPQSVAIAVVVGNISMPVAVLLGVIQ